MQKQLDTIHDWFTSSLKQDHGYAAQSVTKDENSAAAIEAPPSYTFALYEEGPHHALGQGNASILICPAATFVADSDPIFAGPSRASDNTPFLRCTCPRRDVENRFRELVKIDTRSEAAEHAKVQSYGCM
jgi:hypothetical protein